MPQPCSPRLPYARVGLPDKIEPNNQNQPGQPGPTPPGVFATVAQHAPHRRTAVYTGSFDPITLGHLDVIQRASRIFDAIVVGVGINPEKQPIFSLAERVQLVRDSVADLGNVRVELFSGLSVAFVREQGAHVLLRGVRSLTDIDAEFTMTLANRKLDPEVETVFLMADAQYSHISSSLLKQITPLADDEALLKFVPQPVVAPLRRTLSGPA
jgi:pantetheine-phosphate adenylyltransferase